MLFINLSAIEVGFDFARDCIAQQPSLTYGSSSLEKFLKSEVFMTYDLSIVALYSASESDISALSFSW